MCECDDDGQNILHHTKSTLKCVLSQLSSTDDIFWTELLAQCDKEDLGFGLPTCPFLSRLATRILTLHAPPFDSDWNGAAFTGLNDVTEDVWVQIWAEISEKFERWKVCLETQSSIHSTTLELLQSLGKRGICVILGQRCTIGSVHVLPPPVESLIAAFEKVHIKTNPAPTRRPLPPSILTVGAKAWTKHVVRSKNQWWGECRGSQSVLNAQALHILHDMIKATTWWNTHRLPHDVVVLEIRRPEGYGARWYLMSGIEMEFRGFLEPPMDDGHECGWRH